MSCDANCRKTRGRQMHCGSCHLTFSGIGNFDKHRKNGKCNDPTRLFMTERNRIWGYHGTFGKDRQGHFEDRQGHFE